MGNTEHSASVWLLLVSQRQIVDLKAEVAELERRAAYWENEAVLRAATLANDLTLRARQAELAAAEIRAALRDLAGRNLSAETLIAGLGALVRESGDD